MNDFQNMTADEILGELKSKVNTITETNLGDIKINLEETIKNSILTKQISMLERSIFFYELLNKENYLIENNFNKFIEKDDIEELLEKLNNSESNTKRIFFCELEDYPRVIPTDVVRKIKQINDNKIFDKYYVLYTDFTKSAQKFANGNKTGLQVTDISSQKDPILFGAFIKKGENGKAPIIMDRFYYIADWVDEYCDLTLNKLMTIAPELVKEAYGSKSSMEMGLDIELEKLMEELSTNENSGIPNTLIAKINSLNYKNKKLVREKNKKNIFSKIKKVFKWK